MHPGAFIGDTSLRAAEEVRGATWKVLLRYTVVLVELARKGDEKRCPRRAEERLDPADPGIKLLFLRRGGLRFLSADPIRRDRDLLLSARIRASGLRA
ncbi:hypothetical protein KM043_010870 [Ampulex compressa]|nr:hypothetical protein KM043_010870 [Ampulex compressa]